ncbi:MAG: hypothetical protein J6I49_03345 [Bacteroidales bacterium]|nr:hypothetical protein [Bacteroidales bacterium]
MIGWIIVIFILFLLFMIPVGIGASVLSTYYNRQDKLLRDEAEAHRKILEGTYDHIWTNIKQRAGLREEHRRSFNNIYPDLLDKSIDNEGFINWILECNIDFDPQEYVPLLDMVTVSRERFIDHQLRMESLMHEHRLLLSSWPARWFIRDRSAIHYVPMDLDYSRWGRSL